MRVAIFSDIHGNLPALEAVLADIAAQEPDLVYCLGDLVGYGASPNEVTERIRTQRIPTIMGNYDDGVGFERDECGCAYRDPVDLSSFQRLAASSNADVIVFGHTHKPYVKTVDGVLFVNDGSVGKPKDLDWRACFVILENGAVSFRRVEYDVQAAAAAIRATDLPHEFALDIESGGAPRPEKTM